MKFSILHFTTITNLITLIVATDNGFVSSPLNPHQHHHGGEEHNQSSHHHHHHMHDNNNERSRGSNIIHHSSSSALYNPSNRFLTDHDYHRKLPPSQCQGEGGGCKRKSCCSPFICIADVCGAESPPLTPPPTTPNPTTTQPTDAPVTQSPVTPSPVTPSPVTNKPTTNSPVQQGMGYCSNNVAMSCFTNSDCGCSASASATSDEPWLRRLSGIRMLGKPRCNDGTYRKVCSDCTCEDLECVGDPSCAAPTTSNPTVSPSAPPTGAELTPVPSGSPVTNAPTTSQPTDAPTRCECIGAATTQPTDAPVTAAPVTNSPVTDSPSRGPTDAPVTSSPSKSPSVSPQTDAPTNPEITPEPSTSSPSKPPSLSPVTSSPTTSDPTVSPSLSPETSSPSKSPSLSPVTSNPTTSDPTVSPNESPETSSPSGAPTDAPTDSPSKAPTPPPTSASPSARPTDSPVTPVPTSNPSRTPTDPPNSFIVGVADVPIIPDASETLLVQLPPTSLVGGGNLITVSRVSDDNVDAVPVARSYDGHDYETLHPLLLHINCSWEGGSGCFLYIPPYSDATPMHYIIQDYSPPTRSTEEQFARLLIQGTYGPKQATLNEAVSLGSASAWVRDQMDKPASLLRAHYRERANGHIRNDLHTHGVRLACESGARYVQYAFNRWKDVGKTITEEFVGGYHQLKVDGVVRTELSTAPSVEYSIGSTSYVICRVTATVSWWLYQRMSSFVEAPTGEKGTLMIASDAATCMSNPIAINMPAVFFSNDATSIPTAILGDLSDEMVLDTKVLTSVVSPSTCDDFKKSWPNFVRDQSSGLFYVEDRRAELYDNTDGTTAQKTRMLDERCVHVDKTFLNEESCVVRTDCSAPLFGAGELELNADNLRKYYDLDGKYVYRVEDLPLVATSSPCANKNSRFVRKDADGDGTNGCGNQDTSDIFPEVAKAIANVLSASTYPETKRVVDTTDDNWYELGNNQGTKLFCSDGSNVALGAQFTVTIPGSNNPSCWTHSYADEWSVFVMNNWVANHPGNPKFFRESKPNPIADIAEHENTSGNPEDSVVLSFPPWGFHQWNFYNNRYTFENDKVGNWGDRIAFNDLPEIAKSVDVITDVGGTVVAANQELVEVCGSPGEVGNDSTKGHQYYLQKTGEADEELPDTLDQDHWRWNGNEIVWNTVSISADDQLRHRVAWALSSIFVVTENDIALEDLTEAWGAYYDIFVRHANGSFFDILKEVSFSPMMGQMLTFEGSKSLAYQIERNNAAFFPDENYAREIMQLFSIGLFMLNQDGTKKLDSNGNKIETYTNEDIMNLSRGWTNFVIRPDNRENIEPEWSLGYLPNRIDPMMLPSSEGRDVFPKQTLDVDGVRGYIGDQVQRCDQMPDKAWLRAGARWEFRKSSQSLMGKQNPDWWADDGEDWQVQIVLDSTTSSLYQKLCNDDGNGNCQFLSTVILDADITCDGTCNPSRAWWDGVDTVMPCECSLDLPRTVKIERGSQAPIWYEYVEAPCIQMAYPEPGSMSTVKEIGTGGHGNKAMCADNRLPVAATMCCGPDTNPVTICTSVGERTTYQTTVDRCANYLTGYSTCAWDTAPINWDCGTEDAYWQGDYSVHSSPGIRFAWSSAPCSMSAQIDADGRVAIIHSSDGNTIKERVGINTGTYFGAFWDADTYPQASSSCDGIPTCQVQGDTCLCETTVQTTAVFDGLEVPTMAQLLSDLYIGASDPDHFDTGHYTLCTADLCTESEFDIYSRVGVTVNANYAAAFDDETIFAVNGLFLSNTKSIVSVGGSHSFRNAPMFNSPIDQTQHDGLYETDALLRMYANHPNVAPFISTKLIQSLITSNPSPRYVKVVADAFTSGTFSSDGHSFGAGKYGDLEATVAAIMLDSEARSTTLDDDSNHGRAREPLVEIIHIMRAMELGTSSGAVREIDMIQLTGRGIGQEYALQSSVFGFYLSEYAPVGPIMNKGLVAPETQLFDSPKLISYVNGLFSLPLFGLTDCQWWTGFGNDQSRYWLPDYPDAGMYDCWAQRDQFDTLMPLRLRWTPPCWGGSTNVLGASAADVVADIDLLLTGGKLSQGNRAVLEQAYTNAITDTDAWRTGGDISALRAVLQLYSAVPEYHITNNLVDSKTSSTQDRPIPDITLPENPPPVEGYKAIVYLFMAGACDSYSLLVPTDGCGTLYDDYRNVRGDVAIPYLNQNSQWELQPLSIDVSTSNQPCNSFGLHPSLANVHNLYVAGDAALVANVGPLVEPINAADFNAGSKPVPSALFAHNTQTSHTQSVFAQDSTAGGVLGRIGDALNEQEGQAIFDAYSISGTPKILEGAPGVSKTADVLTGNGVASFTDIVSGWWGQQYEDNIEALSQKIVTSSYGETYSASMTNALYRMRLLDGVIGDSALVGDACFSGIDTDIGNQLRQVARMTNSRNGLEAYRDVFYTQIGGFDTHSDNRDTVASLLTQIDEAIGCFKAEMDNQGIWNNVTIVSASEFARTLTSNGLGTDHAWGGNHFILGGSVRGGRIHGDYPSDLTDGGPLNIGRGRLIPTTPWEGVWNGVSEWFGVTPANLPAVLPNKANFATNIFTKTDLFE